MLTENEKTKGKMCCEIVCHSEPIKEHPVVKSWNNFRQKNSYAVVVLTINIALLHYDVIDGNMNEFDEKPNKSHDGKTNGSCKGNFLEFCKKEQKALY